MQVDEMDNGDSIEVIQSDFCRGLGACCWPDLVALEA